MIVDNISGLDELEWRVRLTDQRTNAPITTGSVVMRLCAKGTATPLVEGGSAEVTLLHTSNGDWSATHSASAIATAIAAVPLNGLFDRVVFVAGRGARRVARCRKVAVAGLDDA